jgi:diketogulonate reductase-like aldo/keto reductase
LEVCIEYINRIERLPERLAGYIDLFLIHNPNSGKKLRLETYKALLETREAGKVRDVGVSN